jgi:hypothetical protein
MTAQCAERVTESIFHALCGAEGVLWSGLLHFSAWQCLPCIERFFGSLNIQHLFGSLNILHAQLYWQWNANFDAKQHKHIET